MTSPLRLRRVAIFLLCIVCSFFIGNNSYAASKYSSAYLYADYISGGPLIKFKYRVTLVVYQRCETGTASLSSSEDICYYSTCASGSHTLPLASSDTLYPFCSSHTSSCIDPTQPYTSFIRKVYSDTVSLPVACADWTFEWESWPDHRDNVVNINNGTAGYGYGWISVRCGLDNVHEATCSTPRFVATPNFLWCLNSHNVIPLDPYDPNGDSLVTSNQAVWSNGGVSSSPLCGSRTRGQYAVGYTSGTPIDASASDPYAVNPLTGVVTLTPTGSAGNNRYALGFNAHKYDLSGRSLGYCEADMEVEVQNSYCGDLPTIDSVPFALWPTSVLDTTGGVNNIYVCPKSIVHFDVNGGVQAGSSDVVYIYADTISTHGCKFFPVGDGTSNVVGTYEWTPGGDDVGNHIVTFTVVDSSCGTTSQGLITRRTMTVYIHVLPSVAATKSWDYCGPTSDSVQLNVTGPVGTTYNWSDTASPVTISDSTIPNPWVRPAYTTTYIVTSNAVTPCKNSDTITVFVHPPLDSPSAGPDQTICLNQTAILNPRIKNDTIFWTPGATLNDSLKAKALAFPRVNTEYTLHAYDTVYHCNFQRKTHVIINGKAPRLSITATPDSICPEGMSQLIVAIQEQDCGSATSSCSGTSTDYHADAPPYTKAVSIFSNWPGDPDVFFQSDGGGQRMQMLYTAEELRKLGVMPGYINTVSLNFASKNTTDSFYDFTIRMACTTDRTFAYSSNGAPNSQFGSYSFTTVYPAQNYYTKIGWNTWSLATPYYWDGTSSLVVDMCYAYPDRFFPNTPFDALYETSTQQLSTVYSQSFSFPNPSTPPGVSGCTASMSPWDMYASSKRPQTMFNMCQNNSYTYSWTPSVWTNGGLNSTSIYNPVATDIVKKTVFHVKVVPKDGPANCFSVDSVAVAVDTSNKLKAIPESIIRCRPGYQPLGAQAYGPGPIINLACGTSATLSCPVPDTAKIGNPATASTNYDITPWDDNTTFSQMIISAKDLKAGGMNSGTIHQLDFYIPDVPTTDPIIGFTIKMSCTPKTQFNSYTDTVKNATLTQVFYQDSIYLQQGMNSFKFQTPYNWDTTQNLVFQFCHANTPDFYGEQVLSTGTDYPAWIVYHSNIGDACVGGNFMYQSFYAPQNIRPVVTLEYCSAPSGNFAYKWEPGIYLSDSSAQNPIAYVLKSTKYTVYTQGRNHCWLHDSVQIFIPVHNYEIHPKDTMICDGESVPLTVTGTSPSAVYQWYENGYQDATTLSCKTCAHPVAKPRDTSHLAMDTTTYQLVVTDSVNCNDTLLTRIVVKPIPDVRTYVHDTTISYGGSLMLYATGAQIYTWWPTATLSNPNMVNPVATPTEPTTYTVRGLAADGCAATDTIHVNINYRGNLFVPSGFTPNGDGKNDRFRVANLTFEKIIEFHVFNRWGQEVYTGNDNTGWDGKWNGVDQDMGTYEYLIRVGFPDGFMETFKGNVTLIR